MFISAVQALNNRQWCDCNVLHVSTASVHPPRVGPALSAPPHPMLRPPAGVRRHGGTAGHVCLVQAASGQRGGIHRGVLPAWPAGGRGLPWLHAVWRRARRRRAGRGHLQGAPLSALLLLLIQHHCWEDASGFSWNVWRLFQGKMQIELYVMSFSSWAALVGGSSWHVAQLPEAVISGIMSWETGKRIQIEGQRCQNNSSLFLRMLNPPVPTSTGFTLCHLMVKIFRMFRIKWVIFV